MKAKSPFITLLIFIFTVSIGLNAQSTNVALGKTATTDSDNSTAYPASYAVDGINNTNASRWVSGSGSWPHWIEIDLQDTYDIDQLKFWTGWNGYTQPVGYEFQYWDGATWQVAYDGSQNTSAVVDETFTTITASKVRLYGLSGEDTRFRLYEVEVYGTLYVPPTPSEETTNIALNKTATTDSDISTEYPANYAVDGISDKNASRWVSGSGSWPHWIEIDLQDTYDINQMKFWTGWNGYTKPVGYEFQYWDGATWQVAFDGSQNTSTVVDETFTIITTSKIRLYGLSGQDTRFRLYELEVYGTLAEQNATSLWATNGSDINYTTGNVGIGIIDVPSEYMLAVNGKIIAEEVKVQLNTAWPDYVFEKDYLLPSLNDLKNFISKNGHLPNIPSAKEVEENGFELGEMNALLLEKIEELTLYVLAEEKKQQEQLSKIEALENYINTLPLKKQ